jgi:hypothetical protein
MARRGSRPGADLGREAWLRPASTAPRNGEIEAGAGSTMDRLKLVKMLCGVGFLLVLASNIWTISRWSESRGVYDDVCYLRQAHLFKQFGLDGLNTDIKRDDDHYLVNKLKAIRFAEWNDVSRIPCHTWIEKTNKYAISYPPGTGFALALFPSGFQVIPLFAVASIAIFGFALIALYRAREPASLTLAAVFGFAALYLMINPTKASYSMAPTMVICALVGLLTARLFVKAPQRHPLLLTMLIGFLLGLAVNFRLPNLFLSAGYFLFFGFVLLRLRKLEALLRGGLFGVAYLVGIAPTLVYQAINAGSPLATTYGADPLDLQTRIDPNVLWAYLMDPQSALMFVACVWIGWILRLYGGAGIKSVALVTALNLVANVAFFMTHPIFNPYYLIPILMLSLWSLLFASLMQSTESDDNRLMEQAARP